VKNSFFGYFIPTALLPTKSQIVKAKLVKTPDIAPFELLNGRNIPRQKSPRMGPPIILRVFIYSFAMLRVFK